MENNISIENQHIRLEIMPYFGGKTSSIYHKTRDKEWLYKQEFKGILPDYDSCFIGGIDDVFPNDKTFVLNGEDIPSHGVLWNKPWKYEKVSDSDIVLSVETDGKYGVLCEKRITLNANQITFKYKLKNVTESLLTYMLRFHPAFAISPKDTLDIPCSKITMEESYGTPKPIEKENLWPYIKTVDGIIDISKFYDHKSNYIFNCYFELNEGYIRLISEEGATLSMEFDKNMFPYITYFTSLGGWQNHYTSVIEPSTTKSSDFGNGEGLPVLKPSEEIEFSIKIGVE